VEDLLILLIYVVQPGESKVFWAYPQGLGDGGDQTYGIKSTDLGEETSVASDGKMHQVYRTHFEVHGGLAVKDDRCIKRIANIDVGTLSSAISDADIDDLLIQAVEWLPDAQQAYILLNRTVASALAIYAKDKTNVNWGWMDAGGKRIMTFQDIPVIRTDAITNDEDQIS
jgi:hypothetical protein